MPCEVPYCANKARSIRSGLCGTHYERKRQGREPQLPVEPLRSYAAQRGRSDLIRGLGERLATLTTIDEICCGELNVHPSEIYGNHYYQAA